METPPGPRSEEAPPTPSVIGEQPEAGAESPDAYQGNVGTEGMDGPFGLPGAQTGDVYNQPVLPTPDSPADPSPPAEDVARSRRNVREAYNQGSQGGSNAPQLTPEQQQAKKQEEYKQEQENKLLLNEATALAGKRLDSEYAPDSLEDLRKLQSRAIFLRQHVVGQAVQKKGKEQDQMIQLANNLEKFYDNDDIWLLKPGTETFPGDAEFAMRVVGTKDGDDGLQWEKSPKALPFSRPTIQGANGTRSIEYEDVDQKSRDPLTRYLRDQNGAALLPNSLNDMNEVPLSFMGGRLRRLHTYAKMGAPGDPNESSMREVIRKAVSLDEELRAELVRGESSRPVPAGPEQPLPARQAKQPSSRTGAGAAEQASLQQSEDTSDDDSAGEGGGTKRKVGEHKTGGHPVSEARKGKAEKDEVRALNESISEALENNDTPSDKLQELLRKVEGDPLRQSDEPGTFRKARDIAVAEILSYYKTPAGEANETLMNQRQERMNEAIDDLRGLMSNQGLLHSRLGNAKPYQPEDLDQMQLGVETEAARRLADTGNDA